MRVAGMALLSVLALGSGTAVRAQEIAAGVVVGVNLSTLSVDDSEINDIDFRTGFNLGARFSAAITPNLGLMLEVLYAQKGAKVTEGDAAVTFQFNYLEFPVLARYEAVTDLEGKVKAHGAAGGVLGFQVGCRLRAESGGVQVGVGCDEIGVETKGADLGLMFLGGFEIAVGPGAVLLDFAYNHGLLNVNAASGEGSIKNRTLYLQAGYKIALGAI
jgi:hypothetical protein